MKQVNRKDNNDKAEEEKLDINIRLSKNEILKKQNRLKVDKTTRFMDNYRNPDISERVFSAGGNLLNKR